MKAIQLTRKPTLITLLLSAATLAGYASYRLVTDEPAPEPAVVAEHMDEHADAPSLPDEIPPFEFEDLSGRPAPLAGFANKPLLINFWATWCAPCREEIPLLKAFHEQHDSIDVIGISVDQPEPVIEYAEEIEFNYPVLLGYAESFNAMAFFRNDAQVMPFTAFTAPGGAVLGIRYGELHPEHLENFTTTLEALVSGSIDLETARARMVQQL